MKGYLRIKFLSDTCFSSPTALNATVDTEVAVDEFGLPMASGKTLHGLLRDTYLTVKGALDPAGDGPALLGSPLSLREEGALRIGDAFLADEHGQDLRPWIRFLLYQKKAQRSALPPRALRDAFLSTRVLTAEERTTGAPKTDSLRWVRVVPQETVLIAPLTTKRLLTPAERLLLDRLVRLTRHVGMSRNRGLGLVRISVSWQEADPVIVTSPPLSQLDAARFLHYQLRLTAPCLISARDLDPNSRVTKLFIPGAALRGAVAAALVERQEPAARIADIIASGQVRFLHAYPDADGRRALPTPVTWRRRKDARYLDTDPAAQVQDGLGNLLPTATDHTPASENEQWQPVGTPFWGWRRPAEYVAGSSATRFTTHQRRHRRTGATRKGRIETVFVYEALEPGQTFRGCIALPAGAAGDAIEEVLTNVLQNDSLWLGRSIRSGYGGAPQVEILANAAPASEARLVRAPITKGQEFTVRLTADAVLRNPRTGQHDPWFLEETLRQRFQDYAAVEGVWLQATVARGFNRMWRTELPALPAAAAGAVALLRANSDMPLATLEKLQAHPLGERTAEGHGNFVVVAQESILSLKEQPAPVPSSPYSSNASSSDVPEPASTGSLVSPKALRQAQSRLYRARLRILLANHALTVAETASARSLPTPNLLQRLRQPLRQAAVGGDWQTEYRVLLSPAPDASVPGQLRPRALRAVNEAWIGGASLGDLLRTASQPGWTPPTADGEAEEQTRYRLLAPSEAETLWQAERSEPGLCRFYLDTLLARLARRKQQEARV